MEATKYTHFRYVCRQCKKERLVPIDRTDPSATPHPACCGRVRNMAYTGAVTE